jgi:hypothetical protein
MSSPVRAGSARHQEPPVPGGHERSGSASVEHSSAALDATTSDAEAALDRIRTPQSKLPRACRPCRRDRRHRGRAHPLWSGERRPECTRGEPSEGRQPDPSSRPRPARAEQHTANRRGRCAPSRHHDRRPQPRQPAAPLLVAVPPIHGRAERPQQIGQPPHTVAAVDLPDRQSRRAPRAGKLRIRSRPMAVDTVPPSAVLAGQVGCPVHPIRFSHALWRVAE